MRTARILYGMTTDPRPCAECGEPFRPGRAWQRFCTQAHKQRFHKLMAKRGQMLAPLLIAKATVGGRYPALKDAALAAWARKEADALLSRWVIEDRAARRSSASVVAAKQEAGWRAADAVD